MSDAGGVRMTLAELHVLARDTLVHLGLATAHADAVAATIVAGERDGCGSHGIYRLLLAARSLHTGLVDPTASPVLSEPARALVRADGRGGFAQVAFAAARDVLVRKARDSGIAALALNNVVHFAALWPEVEELAREGLVALACTPSHAWVAPAGGTRPVFGTNPIAFGWPRPGRAPFVFDFATSAVARGEIELHHRAGRKIPDDWGYDASGNATTDAAAVLDGAMRTFGGHKGSALAAMVELLAGPLVGDLTSAESLAADAGAGASPRGGELIIAIDPAGFLGDEVATHLARAEAMFAAIEAQGARLPSTRRYAARARSLAEGVVIAPGLLSEIMALAPAAAAARPERDAAVPAAEA